MQTTEPRNPHSLTHGPLNFRALKHAQTFKKLLDAHHKDHFLPLHRDAA